MERLKIIIALALGSFIGSLVAIEINHYFWWLGLLVGGAVGYLSYEFKVVLVAVVNAVGYAYVRFPGIAEIKSFVIGAALGAWIFINRIMCLALFISLFYIILNLFANWDRGPFTSTMQPLVIYWRGMFYGVILMAMLSASLISLSLPGRQSVLDNFFKFTFYHLPKFIVLKIIVGVPVNIVKALIVAARVTPRVARTIGRFVKVFATRFFRLIHSDIRLLCAVDSAIGSAVGYFAGSAIIGLIAGVLFGLVNYEVVSKRVLKLVPINRE
jgi:uncharacterized membrane protein (UPF0136 family)